MKTVARIAILFTLFGCSDPQPMEPGCYDSDEIARVEMDTAVRGVTAYQLEQHLTAGPRILQVVWSNLDRSNDVTDQVTIEFGEVEESYIRRRPYKGYPAGICLRGPMLDVRVKAKISGNVNGDSYTVTTNYGYIEAVAAMDHHIMLMLEWTADISDAPSALQRLAELGLDDLQDRDVEYRPNKVHLYLHGLLDPHPKLEYGNWPRTFVAIEQTLVPSTDSGGIPVQGLQSGAWSSPSDPSDTDAE